ncbi:hypothetical protein C7H19_16325 [Aphanothece hegewaldii CCALA 016]|uniref:Uncharacterized protein n=1 Tax=Aphanothece hegewaldii CCALA 016 TaxID=2107694 RepID=A0A2T1LVG0_9CHRO|nr:hypothetical protein [Aphanothece hegewaldii]PSF35571.1 hypothetical protein C7H19_16325 [Aphanothece hegewaldii CCALA 016]
MTIRDSILIECAEDYVGLWSIVWEFRNSGSETDVSEVRRKTIKLIEELLNDKLIEAGNFTKDGNFEVWKLPSTEIISQIKAEWDALGRYPSIGEIVWFVATEKEEC